MELTEQLTYGRTVSAVGWLSGYLAKEADAWDGKAPDWFPQPPQWLELWNRALAETEERDG